MSEETARKIDEEVRVIIDDCYGRAKTLLETHSDKLHAMADALMEYETLNSDQINDIMEGMPPPAPEDPSNRRPPSAPEGSMPPQGRPRSCRRRLCLRLSAWHGMGKPCP